MPKTAHYSPFTIHYFGARLYHSTASVWLSVDPLSDKYPSVSPYVYCAGNPVRLVDPDGRTFYEVDGEKKHINDGRDNITVHNVSQRQFNRLERRFSNNEKRYNRLAERIMDRNGYTECSTTGCGSVSENGTIQLPEISCTDYAPQQSFSDKFKQVIRTIDDGGHGDYFDRKCAEKAESFAMGAALINPLVGVPNAVKIVTMREDIYGMPVKKTDIGVSWIGIGLTATESTLPELSCANTLYSIVTSLWSSFHYQKEKNEKK